jgi:hypothetical protein
MLQTVYREIDFEDEQIARQHRDRHLSELQAQGMDCVAEDLYNAVNGWRVFTLVATLPAPVEESQRLRPAPSASVRTIKAQPRPQRSQLQDSEPQKLRPERNKRTYEVR